MSARDVAERLRKRRSIEKVTTDEGTLYVRGLTGKERAEWAEKFVGGDLTLRERILSDQHLVAVALCDETGAALFQSFEEAFEVVCDFQDQDVKAAAKKVMAVSGMSKNSVEDAEKKSDAIQS